IPNTHLVMHGSSSVPQDWLAIINQYGGAIKETYGVPLEQIVEGIKYGVRKVNIDTDLRLASTGAIRQFLAKNPEEFDPRKYQQDQGEQSRANGGPGRKRRGRPAHAVRQSARSTRYKAVAGG